MCFQAHLRLTNIHQHICMFDQMIFIIIHGRWSFCQQINSFDSASDRKHLNVIIVNSFLFLNSLHFFCGCWKPISWSLGFSLHANLKWEIYWQAVSLHWCRWSVYGCWRTGDDICLVFDLLDKPYFPLKNFLLFHIMCWYHPYMAPIHFMKSIVLKKQAGTSLTDDVTRNSSSAFITFGNEFFMKKLYIQLGETFETYGKQRPPMFFYNSTISSTPISILLLLVNLSLLQLILPNSQMKYITSTQTPNFATANLNIILKSSTQWSILKTCLLPQSGLF